MKQHPGINARLLLQVPDHPEHVPYHSHHPMFVARVPVNVCGEGEVEVVAAQHVPFPVLTTGLYSCIHIMQLLALDQTL